MEEALEFRTYKERELLSCFDLTMGAGFDLTDDGGQKREPSWFDLTKKEREHYKGRSLTNRAEHLDERTGAKYVVSGLAAGQRTDQQASRACLVVILSE
jgi:hypothetical protein